MQDTFHTQDPPKKHRRILSLDGGGIRGLLLLEKLIVLERKTNKRIYQLFDTIVGTSTGGLVTILLTIPTKKNNGTENAGLPMKATEAKDAYLTWAQKIFPKPLLNTYSILALLILTIVGFFFASYYPETHHSELSEKQRSLFLALRIVLVIIFLLLIYRIFSPLFLPFYSRKHLLDFIDEYYEKDISLKDALTNVGIVATILPYGESFVFNTMRAKLNDPIHNSRLSYIAAATSAAPTYFEPVEIDLEKQDESSKKWLCRSFLKNIIPKIYTDHQGCQFDDLPYWSSNRESEPLLEGKFLFEDGGTSSNNPAKLGLKLDKSLMKLKGLKCKEYQIKLLSVGTGTLTGEQDDPTKYSTSFAGKCCAFFCCLFPCCVPSNSDGGLDNVIFRILGFDPFMVSINSYNTHAELNEKFNRKGKEQNYVRFQFKITANQLAQMDNTSKSNTKSLIDSAVDKLKPSALSATYDLLGIPKDQTSDELEREFYSERLQQHSKAQKKTVSFQEDKNPLVEVLIKGKAD